MDFAAVIVALRKLSKMGNYYYLEYDRNLQKNYHSKEMHGKNKEDQHKQILSWIFQTKHHKEARCRSFYQLGYLFGSTKISKFDASFVIYKYVCTLIIGKQNVCMLVMMSKSVKNEQNFPKVTTERKKFIYFYIPMHDTILVKIFKPPEELLWIHLYNLFSLNK